MAGPPFAVRQHSAYLGALEGTGVTVHVTSFKRRETTCPHTAAPGRESASPASRRLATPAATASPSP